MFKYLMIFHHLVPTSCHILRSLEMYFSHVAMFFDAGLLQIFALKAIQQRLVKEKHLEEYVEREALFAAALFILQ